MFGPHIHKQIAENMIENILLQGNHIRSAMTQPDTYITIAGYKDESGKVVGFGVYNGQENNMQTIYEGDQIKEAIESYINILGPFVAMGNAIKFFRENNA